jgi:UDP-glucuronate 4-epimerase
LHGGPILAKGCPAGLRRVDSVAILVTGAAGFIGHHVAMALRRRGHRVVAVDNFNSYYDPALKQARMQRLRQPCSLHPPGAQGVLGALREVRLDVTDRVGLAALMAEEPEITGIVHLAAQAGVRHSLADPYAYVEANVMGHVTLIEAARRLPALEHVVYASSSSVYGLNDGLPFRETDAVDRPTSLYAATKRADELIGHAYAHLYGLRQTGLRFFTVYGPWGRPDMAYYGFAEAILAGRPITLFDGGRLRRDFTYLDDVVDGVLRVLGHPPPPADPRILNIGNSRSEAVADLVALLEAGLGRKAVIEARPRPVADVEATWASVEAIGALTGWRPTTSLATGIGHFVRWLLAFQEARREARENGAEAPLDICSS